jgi:hypothetical protein
MAIGTAIKHQVYVKTFAAQSPTDFSFLPSLSFAAAKDGLAPAHPLEQSEANVRTSLACQPDTWGGESLH